MREKSRKKNAEYLFVSELCTPQLYLLPKIHKGMNPPPGRPIILANECPTERISQLVDHFLQPYLPTIKSWIKDSGHCIHILQKIASLKPGSLISSIYVVCLYPNMDQEECISSVRKFLIENRDPNEKPSTEFLIDLLRFVLKFNNFQFDGKDYLQFHQSVNSLYHQTGSC